MYASGSLPVFALDNCREIVTTGPTFLEPVLAFMRGQDPAGTPCVVLSCHCFVASEDPQAAAWLDKVCVHACVWQVANVRIHTLPGNGVADTHTPPVEYVYIKSPWSELRKASYQHVEHVCVAWYAEGAGHSPCGFQAHMHSSSQVTRVCT
jgi:hypothetical protein